MEIEKLIKHMRKEAQDYRAGRTLGRAFADAEDVLDEAATALEQLQAENGRLKRERDAAVNDYRVLPEKCVCMTTCGGKKIAIVLDVEAMKETAHD